MREGERRRCGVCGAPVAAGAGFCPVCRLRGALGQADGPGEPALGSGKVEPVSGPLVQGFGHYELVRGPDGKPVELGRGAMGVSYKALDTVLGHAVALKVIEAHLAGQPEARERFLREARAAARVRHPNVASVFYYGVRQSDGQCFYAMELVEGESLEARVRRAGPLPALEALEIVAQAARALAAAEANGLVHRDLKPSNLMLARMPDLTVKIIDFGLAKAMADPGQGDLTHGAFVGTPAFASPEQFSGGSVDIRSDLYSLGATLWQMLSGQAPFRGTPAELMRQHLHAPLPLDQLGHVPQPVIPLVEVLLDKDPGRRFQNPADLLRALAAVRAAVEAGRPLGRPGLQGLRPAGLSGINRKRRPALGGPKQICIARLPVTGKELFGRKEELAFLDAAWADPQVNVITIVAWAGVGKSTLVNHWLRRLAADHYRSAEFVFGWSFYRQGSTGEAASADEFVDAALAWFGDADPRRGTPWEKGERLARLVAPRRTLLVLDGLEPLQNPPGAQEGRLREPALQALLRELAAFNMGLCVITTRLAVADVADHGSGSVRRCDLDHLSPEAGAQLLRALGVRGDEAALRRAGEEFGGHCLALTLLGSYLTDAYGGDICCRDEVSKHLAHDVRQGAHARKVMGSYQSWFGEGAELSVLRLLGLFDRPADAKALEALLKPPAIPGLTEPLMGLSPAEWRTLLARLRRARLLADEDPHQPGNVDAHPLVREFFGEQLRSQRPAAWQESNRRLYHHYRMLAPPFPENVRAMEPLCLAVICGCQAGLYRQALHEVYLPRIQRGEASFAAKALGARGALLSILIHFFEHGCWGPLVETGAEGQKLTADDQLFILMQAGLYLSATRGFAAPEARLCYEGAEAICHLLDRPLPLYSALIGQWRHSLHNDKLTTTLQLARGVYALAQGQNDAALMIGACRALAATHYFRGDFEAARQHATRGVELWRAGGMPSPAVEEVLAPAVVCLCLKAMSDWHAGEIASGHAALSEAIALAKKLNDTQALALACYWAGFLAHFEGDPAEVARMASEQIELSTRQHFPTWLPAAAVLRGWARSASGWPGEGIAWIEDGMSDVRAPGFIRSMPSLLALKAEALHLARRTPEALEAVSEAEAVAERYEERAWCAELHRLRGVFLASMGADEEQIEAAFGEALRTAQQQKSISLMKRAEASRAEYRGQRGSR